METSLDINKLPFLFSGKYRAFPINDDSMPPLHKDNIIVCKYIESHTEIIDGGTYVLIKKPDNIVYKRIKRHPDKNDTIILNSDNRFYLPYEIKMTEITEIWEFVCSLNIDSYKPEELNIGSVIRMLRELKVEIRPIGYTQ
jgi:Peptidase S24-like